MVIKNSGSCPVLFLLFFQTVLVERVRMVCKPPDQRDLTPRDFFQKNLNFFAAHPVSRPRRVSFSVLLPSIRSSRSLIWKQNRRDGANLFPPQEPERFIIAATQLRRSGSFRLTIAAFVCDRPPIHDRDSSLAFEEFCRATRVLNSVQQTSPQTFPAKYRNEKRDENRRPINASNAN